MFRSWWQQIKQHWIATIIIVFVGVIVFIVLAYLFKWDWTGLNATDFTSTPQNITRTIVYQPGKTLWDWLGLLGVLAIPVVVGFGAAWFTAQQGKLSERENKNNQRETALQEYITKMSELLLEKNLRESAKNEEVRKIARVRTLTILRRLDGDCVRKRSVLLFLHEAGLVGTYNEQEGIHEPIIDLWDADFSQADLSRAHLFGVSLIKANLRGADLSCTFLNNAKFHWAVLSEANLSNDNRCADYRDEKPNLKEVDFSKAYLDKARLINADLSRANLREADLREANLSGALQLHLLPQR